MLCCPSELPGKSVHTPVLPLHFMWLQPMTNRVSRYFENLMLAVTTDVVRLIEKGHDNLEPMLLLSMRNVGAEMSLNTRANHCPSNGEAAFFDLLDSTGQVGVTNAALACQEPLEITARLASRIAFDPTRSAVETAPV